MPQKICVSAAMIFEASSTQQLALSNAIIGNPKGYHTSHGVAFIARNTSELFPECVAEGFPF